MQRKRSDLYEDPLSMFSDADMMVKRIMEELESGPVYKAEINCRAAGRSLPLLGCVMDSGIKVRNGVKAELYDIRRLGRTLSLKLSLREHFHSG